jgi:hypothetical protein
MTQIADLDRCAQCMGNAFASHPRTVTSHALTPILACGISSPRRLDGSVDLELA